MSTEIYEYFDSKSEENKLREDLKVLAADENMPLTIVLAGFTYPSPGYIITRQSAPIFVIEYVTGGVGYVDLDGEIHKICKDTVYILKEGERHRYYADENDPFSKIFMNFSGSMAEKLLSSYKISDKYFFSGNGLLPIFERILEVIRSDASEQEMQASLQGILVEILSRLSQSESEARHSPEALKLKAYLDSADSRIVSAGEMAKYIFRSPDYCLKLFKREFGITPYAYQVKRKMEIAKSLLTDTAMTVGEIAVSLGYSDVHYFSNLFYAKCKCRPFAYRKKKR